MPLPQFKLISIYFRPGYRPIGTVFLQLHIQRNLSAKKTIPSGAPKWRNPHLYELYGYGLWKGMILGDSLNLCWCLHRLCWNDELYTNISQSLSYHQRFFDVYEMELWRSTLWSLDHFGFQTPKKSKLQWNFNILNACDIVDGSETLDQLIDRFFFDTIYMFVHEFYILQVVTLRSK